MKKYQKIIKRMILTFLTGILICGCFNARETLTLTQASQKISAKKTKPTKQPTPTPISKEDNIPVITIEPKKLPSTAALKFTGDMKIGWNLGNTLDATSDSPLADELQYESAWCGIVTTKKMIDKIKKAGFRTVRIPVSWHNHVSGKNFTIHSVWMDRVQEIVDYVIDNGMYAILNIHHDTDVNYYYPAKKYLKRSKRYVSRIWKQVAERFADYDDHLIFESLNEPRLVGTNYEWWLDSTNEDCKEAVDCINQLNQSFVNTVRKAGGNNKERYLMIPGYCASADGALNDQFKLPSDTAEEKLIVSVHAYTPYSFALQSPFEQGSTDEFKISDPNSTKEIDSLMERLYEGFISKGVPVVIGEFGAREKNKNTKARIEYAAYYIAAARANKITCCWWDNNSFLGDGENFGLFNRQKNRFQYKEIVNAMMKYAKQK